MRKKNKKIVAHISPLPVINYSGFTPGTKNIEIPKKHQYIVLKNFSITGEAPKDIIRLYEYGKTNKKSHKKWPIYIAKFGNKYYPMESVTEQLMTDIGLSYGFDMAYSKLCLLGGQIRFLSRYFLSEKDEILFHGADMYAGFLNDDKRFVDNVEKEKMTQAFFTTDFTKKVFDFFFQDRSNNIYEAFMRMLFYDALVGNNDRHMYNWGIVKKIFGTDFVVFSKIYDSARGLLWNRKESKIELIIKNNQDEDFIRNYCNKSKPKIGIEGKENINHFELVEYHKDFYQNDEFIRQLFNNSKIFDVIEVLEKKYRTLMSPRRIYLIKKILIYRYQRINKILFDHEK